MWKCKNIQLILKVKNLIMIRLVMWSDVSSPILRWRMHWGQSDIKFIYDEKILGCRMIVSSDRQQFISLKSSKLDYRS